MLINLTSRIKHHINLTVYDSLNYLVKRFIVKSNLNIEFSLYNIMTLTFVLRVIWIQVLKLYFIYKIYHFAQQVPYIAIIIITFNGIYVLISKR